MKKRTIYILLIALVGLSFSTACNDKEFYDYVKTPDGKPTPDDPVVEPQPYALNLTIKMNAEDLARLEKIEGRLNGIVAYTPPTASRATAGKNSVDFEFTKTADGISASIQVLAVDKSIRQVLVIAMTHTNGNVTRMATDVSENLLNLEFQPTDAPIGLGIPDIILPGKADDAIGGGTLNDWSILPDVDGEAGSEITGANN